MDDGVTSGRGFRFKPSQRGTVGVEWELQILDGKTLDLTRGILPLLAALGRSVRPELNQFTVEIATDPHAGLADLEMDLRSGARNLLREAGLLGFKIAGGGVHPFSERPAPVTPLPRYKGLEREKGILVSTQVTFAMHVHFGVETPEDCIRLAMRLRPALPLLVAASANSPIWHGRLTSHPAFRRQVLGEERSYGLPPEFPDWQAFVSYLTTARRAGIIRTIKDVHWDLRPRPDFGTVELRVLDSPTTASEVMRLARFQYALCSALLDGRRLKSLPDDLPWYFLKENLYRASRMGLEAALLMDESGRTANAGDLLSDLARELSVEMPRPGYLELLRIFEMEKDPASVSRAQVAAFMSDLLHPRGSRPTRSVLNFEKQDEHGSHADHS